MQLPHEWRARPYQIPLWRYLRYEDGKRAIAIWHRRAGKDEVALHWAAVAQKLKVANYWHMLPEYAQARKAIWNAVNPHSGRRRIDEAFPQALRKATNEQEMFIRFRNNGSTWQVVGSDSYNKLIGTPPYGVVVSEWATADPAAWAYLAPILAENGGWAVFITTPRGRNHACKMYEMARDDPQWFADLATYRDTGALSDAQVEAQRREYRSIFGEVPGDALIEQEYLCSFDAAVLGAYWAAELAAAEREGRVRELDADPALPVHTVWDLGIGDSTAIFWWQASGDEVRILDHHEAHGQGLAYYARLVHAKPWRRGDDHVPHDARVRELGTGRTRIETMRALGLQPRLVPDHKLMDGINAARLVIPKCFFDAARCRTALELLRQYRAAYDDKARVFGATPKHDFTSHTADTFRYLAMAWRELAAEPPPRPIGRGLGEMTLNGLWEAEARARSRSGF